MAEQGFSAKFEDKEVREFLKDFQSRLKNVKDGEKEFVGLLSAIVYGDVMQHFDNESGPEGKWKVRSDNPKGKGYKSRIEAEGYTKILQVSGRLRNNFKPNKFATTSQGVFWFNDATTKSGYAYAWGHNEGDGKLPQREFMWLSDKAMEEIEKRTLQYMIDKGL